MIDHRLLRSFFRDQRGPKGRPDGGDAQPAAVMPAAAGRHATTARRRHRRGAPCKNQTLVEWYGDALSLEESGITSTQCRRGSGAPGSRQGSRPSVWRTPQVRSSPARSGCARYTHRIPRASDMRCEPARSPAGWRANPRRPVLPSRDGGARGENLPWPGRREICRFSLRRHAAASPDVQRHLPPSAAVRVAIAAGSRDAHARAAVTQDSR